MTIKHILAMKSDSGELSLYDQTDDFSASFKGGEWINDSVFEFRDLEQNFFHIDDDSEIRQIMNEARSALGKPLGLNVPRAKN